MPNALVIAALLCHNAPARSQLFGLSLPVCCRCAGIWGFLLLGFVVNLRLRWGHRDPMRVAMLSLSVGLTAGITACAEILIQTDAGNLVRFISGVCSGLGIGVALNVALLSPGLQIQHAATGRKGGGVMGAHVRKWMSHRQSGAAKLLGH